MKRFIVIILFAFASAGCNTIGGRNNTNGEIADFSGGWTTTETSKISEVLSKPSPVNLDISISQTNTILQGYFKLKAENLNPEPSSTPYDGEIFGQVYGNQLKFKLTFDSTHKTLNGTGELASSSSGEGKVLNVHIVGKTNEDRSFNWSGLLVRGPVF